MVLGGSAKVTCDTFGWSRPGDYRGLLTSRSRRHARHEESPAPASVPPAWRLAISGPWQQ